MTAKTPVIHYVVRYASINYKTPDNIDFKFYETEFRNDDPIVARQQALSWYENESHIHLLRIGLSDIHAENLTGQDLQAYFNSFEKNATGSIDDAISLWMFENPDAAAKLPSYGHPEVLLVIDDEALLDEDKRQYDLSIIGKELPIYKIVNLTDPFDVSEYLLNLDQEYSIYKYFNYNTGNLEQAVTFFDPEVFYDGQEGEIILETHQILRTPFEWQGYDQKLWWMNEEEIKETIESLNRKTEVDEAIPSPFGGAEGLNHKMIIANGEGHQIEFKPCLFARVDKRNIQREIFNVICSFLNSSGGFLYLGISDNGQPHGVNLSGISKDKYRLNFTQLKNSYFENGVSSSNIIGDFISVENKDVFWISVEPSSLEPIFLVNKFKRADGEDSKTNHLYVRQEASSPELRDPKKLVEYVKNKWFSKQ